MLFEEGILVTVAPYPMMKKGEEVHRISITASNTEKEIQQLINAFKKIKGCL
jgi:8-amino-7-oxononanoate synthase